MDPFMARTMVEASSKGLDPRTGCVLPQRDSCSDEDIQDALLEVLAHCTIESVEEYNVRLKEEKKQHAEENKKRYAKSGQPWTRVEEKDLLSMHQRGMNIWHISNVLHRSPGGVESHLKKLQDQPIKRTKKTPQWPIY